MPAGLVVAEAVGRRAAMAGSFVLMFIASRSGSAGCSTWRTRSRRSSARFVLGLGGANFTLWIPEQFTTECRGSAIGFTSSVGRFVGVAMVLLVGAGLQRDGSLGMPVALTAIAFVIGLLVLPAAKETKGKPLPA